MQKLVVLDYTNCDVHIYDVEENVEITESLVASLGHKLSMCHYMAGNVNVVEHDKPIEF